MRQRQNAFSSFALMFVSHGALITFSHNIASESVRRSEGNQAEMQCKPFVASSKTSEKYVRGHERAEGTIRTDFGMRIC